MCPQSLFSNQIPNFEFYFSALGSRLIVFSIPALVLKRIMLLFREDSKSLFEGF